MLKIKKILFVLYRNILYNIEPFNSNIYMKKYIKLLKRMGMKITGTPRYIAPSVHFDGNDLSLISIGNDTVISKNVEFLTHDFSIARGLQAIDKKVAERGKDEFFLKKIHIGNNCFIGLNSTLLPGCSIGDNVIVGAGSVVRGYIPDNVIIYGNPATVRLNTLEWANKKLEKREFYCE